MPKFTFRSLPGLRRKVVEQEEPGLSHPRPEARHAESQAANANSGDVTDYPKVELRAGDGIELSRRTPANYGEALDEMVRLFRAVPRPDGYGPEYDLIREAFDPAFYFSRYPDIFRARLDPVAHYIRAGAREGRDPTPTFSTRGYQRRHASEEMEGLTPFGHWLSGGGTSGGGAVSPFAAMPGLAASLGEPEEELEARWIARHQDVRRRLDHGKLGEMAVRAAELDPSIALSWGNALDVRIAGFTSDLVMFRTIALRALARSAQDRPARAVIVLGDPHGEQARDLARNMLEALVALHGAESVLVLETGADKAAEWGRWPTGVRRVAMSDVHLSNATTGERILMEFLRILRPEVVFNLDSSLMWDVMGPYGLALAEQMTLVACLLDAETNAENRPLAPSIDRVYRHFDTLTAICTLGPSMAETLKQRYLIPPDQADKIVVLQAPVEPSTALEKVPSADPGRRACVFCTLGVDRRRDMTFLRAVAGELADVDFRVFDPYSKVVDPQSPVSSFAAENIAWNLYRGRFADLPFDEVDAWLHIDDGDDAGSGGPEVAMRGVPIVAVRFGPDGADEINLPATVLVTEPANPRRAVEAIRAILNEPVAAREEARRIREWLVSRRSTETYRDRISTFFSTVKHPVDRMVSAKAAAVDSPPDGNIDLTLMLTVHSETLVAGPTIRSAEAALARVEAAGYRVERLVGLDTPTDASRKYMDQPALSEWCRHEFTFRDQGLTRNALVQAARGRWLAVLDADDLISENWLEAALASLSQPDASRSIVHPEVMWQFDRANVVRTTPMPEDRFFSPWHFAMQNYYNALCVAPRAAWKDHPYPERDVERGFAYEDWQWTLETMAAGWKHEVARDTITFERRKDVSQSHESRTRRTCIRPIPALAIDRIPFLGRGAPVREQ